MGAASSLPTTKNYASLNQFETIKRSVACGDAVWRWHACMCKLSYAAFRLLEKSCIYGVRVRKDRVIPGVAQVPNITYVAYV